MSGSRIYRVVIEYQNIESGGSSRFKWERNLEAENFLQAIQKGLDKNRVNVDGRVFSVFAEEVRVEK